VRRRRHRQGNLKVVRGRHVAQWWEDGHRRNKVLGMVSSMTKSQALDELTVILASANARGRGPSESCTFWGFCGPRVFTVLPPQVEKFDHCLQCGPPAASPHLRIQRAHSRLIHPKRIAGFVGPEGGEWPVIQHSGPPTLGPKANFRNGPRRGLRAEESCRTYLYSKPSKACYTARHDLAGSGSSLHDP
jgi:hypothetical protein